MIKKYRVKQIFSRFSSINPLLLSLFLFCFALFFAVPVIFFLLPPLTDNNLALGIHTVSMAIPFVTAFSFFTCCLMVYKKITLKIIFLSVLLFLILLVPFWSVLFNPIYHHRGDDSYRYSVYAQNMIQEKTLWGSDSLVYNDPHIRYYIDQPGYRYYVALTILLFQKESRLMQFFNLFLILVVAMFLLREMVRSTSVSYSLLFSSFFLLSSPYFVKNILYCYSEWFVIMLFFLFLIFFFKKMYYLSVIFLALIPFIRQNLLLISLFTFFLIIFFSKRERTYLIPYFLILLLPFYHNLYYAHELRFFVANIGLPFDLSSPHALIDMLRVVGYNSLHYIGYYPQLMEWHQQFTWLFVPYGFIITLYLFIKRFYGRSRIIFSLIILLTIGPTLIFGWGSPPRFEFVNLFIILSASFLLLTNNIRASRLVTPE